MQFDVRSGETYTMHGVPVQVDGVCMVKIDAGDEGVERAAEQFLSRGRDDIVRTAHAGGRGPHARGGRRPVDRGHLPRAPAAGRGVRELARAGPRADGPGHRLADDPHVADKQGYLEALGRPRTAQVKRDAIRGEAEAEREAKAARYEADWRSRSRGATTRSRRRPTRPRARRARAEADLAYDLQRAITRQQVRAEELQVEIVERQKAIELMEAEVERRKRELEAEVIEPALARGARDRGAGRGRARGAGGPGRRRGRRAAAARGWPRPRRWPPRRAPGASTTRRRSPTACSRSCPQLAAAVSAPLGEDREDRDDRRQRVARRGAHDHRRRDADRRRAARGARGADRQRLDDLVKALPKTGVRPARTPSGLDGRQAEP